MIAFPKELQEEIREKQAIGVYPPIVTKAYADVSLEAALQASREGRLDVAANLARLAADFFVQLSSRPR